MNWRRQKKVRTYAYPDTSIDYRVTLMVLAMSLPDVNYKLIIMKANSLIH